VYEVPGEHRPGCRDVRVLTLAMLAVIAPLIGAVAIIAGGIAASIWLFTIHPALALIPVALIVAAIVIYARWEQIRYRPPGL